jgi:hypothetical protein
MRRTGRALLFALTAFAAAFVVGSFQPHWKYVIKVIVAMPDTDYVNRVDTHETSLWGWLILEERNGTESRSCRLDNLRSLALLTTVAAVIGLGVYWLHIRRHQPQEAHDFADGPTGLTTDGRIPPAREMIPDPGS